MVNPCVMHFTVFVIFLSNNDRLNDLNSDCDASKVKNENKNLIPDLGQSTFIQTISKVVLVSTIRATPCSKKHVLLESVRLHNKHIDKLYTRVNYKMQNMIIYCNQPMEGGGGTLVTMYNVSCVVQISSWAQIHD